MNKTLGQVGYEAYCSHTNWKSLISGENLPQWGNVKPEIQNAWEHAGERIRVFLNGGIETEDAIPIGPDGKPA